MNAISSLRVVKFPVRSGFAANPDFAILFEQFANDKAT